MFDMSKAEYNKDSAELVKILCNKTQNSDELFFHVLVAYYFCKITSMMRVGINTHDRGNVPINMYAINLATSGYGKGLSTNIVEEQVIHIFRERFVDETFPTISEMNLVSLANTRALKKATDPNEELKRVKKEFTMAGELAFSFDSGTPAAVKQLRHKLLMAEAGSMNMEIDEIGSNLLGNVDVLNPFLELYDVGKIKQKLTKNTAENIRGEEIDGRTPTNMMLFGTPSKLFDGGRIEHEFLSMLEAGYARRCLFGYSGLNVNAKKDDPLARYNSLTDSSSESFILSLADKLGNLADPVNFGHSLNISKDLTLKLIEYQIWCENRAAQFGDHDEIRKAEMTHRYFKALKLAGMYAFIGCTPDIQEEHLLSAIKLVEASGVSFDRMLTRDKNYVKLAKYISKVGTEVTHVDLTEALPFYKGSESFKREMMTQAVAYGYRNNMIIKKVYNDGIEFLQGETLEETDLSKMKFAYSTDLAQNYVPKETSFNSIHKLTQAEGYHWISHHMVDGHRLEKNAIPGFNIVVIDVDGGVPMATAELLLKDYKNHMYTTKRHTDSENRFRILIPLSHTLKLDADEYKEFMNNIYEWLPFEVDDGTNQRSKKWLSHRGTYSYNEGEMLDALQFIPKTKKNDERKQILLDQQSMTHMERWFMRNTGNGNRNRQLHKYAMMLVDNGYELEQIQNSVMTLNSKLPEPMDETEILTSIMKSATKAFYHKDAL
jgi:hypothetical protein